jgi:hypothetical protein
MTSPLAATKNTVAVGAKSLIAFKFAGLDPVATTLSIPEIPDARATVRTASKASRFSDGDVTFTAT